VHPQTDTGCNHAYTYRDKGLLYAFPAAAQALHQLRANAGGEWLRVVRRTASNLISMLGQAPA